MRAAENVFGQVISSVDEAAKTANEAGIEEEVNIVDDPDDIMCGFNMVFCDKHLRCELLPDGLGKDQIPEGACPEDVKSGKAILDPDGDEGLCTVGLVWNKETRQCVPKEEMMESGIKKICINCGGYIKFVRK